MKVKIFKAIAWLVFIITVLTIITVPFLFQAESMELLTACLLEIGSAAVFLITLDLYMDLGKHRSKDFMSYLDDMAQSIENREANR